MRSIINSNSVHDNMLIPLTLAYPKKYSEYGYIFSFKVSSRVIERYVFDGYLDKTHFSIDNKKSVKIEEGFNNVLRNIDTIFILLKDAKEKVYSGILERSDYKDYKDSKNTLNFYKPILRDYLTNTKFEEKLDPHHGRYFESMYYVILGIYGKTMYSIDLDHKDYKHTYNIVSAKDYHKDFSDHPKLHTNSLGYDLIANLLEELPANISKKWYDLISREQHFEKLVREIITPISKKDHQKFVNTKHNPYIV